MSGSLPTPTVPLDASEGLVECLSSNYGAKFRLEYLHTVAAACRTFGATNSQLAKLLGVSSHAIERWTEKIPEFADAISKARAESDSRVEDALFKRATGYTVKSTKVFCDKQGNVTEVPHEVHHEADVNAATFWLKNRRKQEWADLQRTEVTGSGGSPLPIINITLNAPQQPALDGPSVPAAFFLDSPRPLPLDNPPVPPRKRGRPKKNG